MTTERSSSETFLTSVPDSGSLIRSEESVEARRRAKLEQQRLRRRTNRRIDYSPSPLVAAQLERFKRARPAEPIQGVIDRLVMQAAETIPEGLENQLWGCIPEVEQDRT